MTDASQPTVLPAAAEGDDVTVAESFIRRLMPLWVWLACIAVALLAIGPALHGNAFIWTDKALVRDNSFLNRLAGLASLWTGITDPSTYPLPQYSPLTQATFFLDRLIWGDHVWGYRLTSALLHATTGLVLYQLLRRLRIRGAAIAAILFVAHPLTVESVAWLTERRNIVAALLGLSSAFLTLRACGAIAPPPADAKFKPLPPEPERLYGLAAALQLLGLFASPSIAFLPGIVLLLAWRRGRQMSTWLTGTCAGLIVAGIILLGVSAKIERAYVSLPASTWDLDPATRFQLAGRAAATYVGRFVVPYPLSIDYARPLTPTDIATLARRGGAALAANGPGVGPDVGVAWIAPILLAGLLFAAWHFRERIGKGPLVVASAFVLCLLPSLGLVSLGWMQYAFVADRAAYLAVAPLMVGLVAGVSRLLRTRPLLNTAFAVAALVLVSSIVFARLAASRFVDELGFWRTTLAVNPRSLLAVEQITPLELDASDADLVAIDRRVGDALKVRPREPSLLRLNAMTLARGGQIDAALAVLRTAIESEPDYAPAFAYAGELFRQQAEARPNESGPRIDSQSAFRRAAELDRNAVIPRLRLAEADAIILGKIGPDHPQAQVLMDEAIQSLDQAKQLRPYQADALLFGARQLLLLGRAQDAGEQIELARQTDPKNPEVYIAGADVLMRSNNTQAAETLLLNAVALDPSSTRAWTRLGGLRQGQERWDVAHEALSKALANNPNAAEAKARLADVEAHRQTIWPPGSTTMPASAAGPTTVPATTQAASPR